MSKAVEQVASELELTHCTECLEQIEIVMKRKKRKENPNPCFSIFIPAALLAGKIRAEKLVVRAVQEEAALRSCWEMCQGSRWLHGDRNGKMLQHQQVQEEIWMQGNDSLLSLASIRPSPGTAFSIHCTVVEGTWRKQWTHHKPLH